MIELAPYHKIGLSLPNPVMIASGCGGYGNAYQQVLDLSAFGAIVTNPITLRPRRGPNQPRVVETKGGFILHVGEQNLGVKRVIQQYQSVWTHLGSLLIVHLPADEPDDLRRTARALSSLETPQGQTVIAAVELGIPPLAEPQDLVRWVAAVQEGSPLPLLVKLPVSAPIEMAEAVANVHADALVIGAPPTGTAPAPTGAGVIAGQLFGPALHSLALRQLCLVKSWVDLPLVAAGGIHTLAEVQAFLQAGAAAVQLDSLLFIEPKEAQAIASNFCK
jgi:dihydroorotate dehydrogenase (NAD+) catalytic subunit